MPNSTSNIVGLAYIGFSLIALFFIFSIGNYMFNFISQNSLPEEVTNDQLFNVVKTTHLDIISIFQDGILFLTLLLIAYSIFSSFTQRNDVISYLISFATSIIAGALVSYLMIYIYNSFLTSVSSMPEIFSSPNLYLTDFFFEYFNLIVIANIIAGILSFIWINREGAL